MLNSRFLSFAGSISMDGIIAFYVFAAVKKSVSGGQRYPFRLLRLV